MAPYHYGRKWTRTQTKWPSNHSLSHERTDERVAQYFRLGFWLFWTIVAWREEKTREKERVTG